MNLEDETSSSQHPTPIAGEIVVGTDGSAAAGVAVQYALDLGARASAPVRIVHVIPSHLPVPTGLEEAVQKAGTDLVFDVGRRAQLASPQVDVRVSLLEGPRGVQLIAAVRDAAVVVMGRGGRISHLITGSTATALIEHTNRPVRVIPPGWFKRSSRTEVIVAVKDAQTSQALVERGFEIAADLGEPLVLLHVWGLPSGYEEVMALVDTEAWIAHLTNQIAAETQAIRERHSQVPYQIKIVHGRTVNVLEEASRRASFLLLGRTNHHHPIGARTDIPHLLMNVSECPVEIGPEPRDHAPHLDLKLEAQGRLLR